VPRMPRTLIPVIAMIPGVVLLVGCTKYGATLDRSEDPVVGSGARDGARPSIEWHMTSTSLVGAGGLEPPTPCL
jgi:hypothetical protein